MPHDPICVLLLPRELEHFILREQAEDLLEGPGVVAVDPPRVRYGVFGRLPELLGDGLALRLARRLVRTLRRRIGEPRVVVAFHPLQYQLARAIVALVPDCELWYGRWDRYEVALDAGPALRERLEALHHAAAERATLTFVASEELARLEREAGREAEVVGLAAGSFPAPDPQGTVVVLSLGHHGWRVDWTLLRGVAERLGHRLVLLVVGERHDDEVEQDEDFRWCRDAPQFVWLGRQDDEAAARLLLAADVGIVPFRVEPFNDAGLPYRILKAARLGRRTVTPDLKGVRTWDQAVVVAEDADAFAAALERHAGARTAPDLELRDWARRQTAGRVNDPLRRRLLELGIRA